MPIRRPTRPPEDIGNSKETPFVRFDQGTAIYPDNDLHNAAGIVLQELQNRPAPQVFEALIRLEPGQNGYRVTRTSTWFAIIRNFFMNQAAAAGGIDSATGRCKTALELMAIRPHEYAWPQLREFLLKEVDEFSGWNSSFRKTSAEERNVYRGSDGNFYYRDQEWTNQIIQIINAKPAIETRVDFIGDQLLSGPGFLHQTLSLFSLFAIADDFINHTNEYYPLVKASLANPKHSYSSIKCEWHFMHFDYSRAYLWRPYSNLCDPKWLAGDMLAKLTDTLERDFWVRHYDPGYLDQEWLNDGCQFQMDYVVDTNIRIGSEQYVYIPFEDKVIRWINATADRDASLSISVKNLQDHSREDDQLNRFLSLLVWDHPSSARIKWGVGGARTPHSKAVGSRRLMSHIVEPIWLQALHAKVKTEDQRLAIALFREAQNSSSTFYEFLSYWRIFELIFPTAQPRNKWLYDVAIPNLGYLDRLKELVAQHADIEYYLRELKVNGIKHAIKKTVHPDSPADQLSTTRDTLVMAEIAKLAIKDKLAL